MKIKHLFFLLLPSLLMASGAATALEALDDEGMSDVSGAGIAFAFDNFSFRMAPTSFIELTGSPMSATVGPGNNAATAAAYALGWRRGDLRYYGLSMTGNAATGGTDWYGAAGGCVAGTDGLGCPLGGAIKDFASVYNPYMARVFQYAGFSYEGTCLGTVAAGVCSTVTPASPTVYEFIGPSNGDSWRWSFWGQLDIDNGGAGNRYLHSQTIILGKNSTRDGKATKLQLLQTPTSVAGEQSLSLVYQSRLSGDFRFSVQKKTATATSPDLKYVVPDFNDSEGLYFKNVDAFLPLGNLNYQTLVFRNTPTNNGNFIVELTPIPGTGGAASNIYNTHYCGVSTGCTIAPQTGGVNSDSINAGLANCGTTKVFPCRRVGAFTTTDQVVTNPNADTHGYVRWGLTDAQGGTAPIEGSTTDTSNGIYFKDGAGNIRNIGRSKIEGLMLQSLKITSFGAGA